jgi:hypothetical protein
VDVAQVVEQVQGPEFQPQYHKQNLISFSFSFLVGLEFELRVSHVQSRCSATLATPPVQFTLLIFFGDRVSRTVSPGWPQTMILLISASELLRFQV